MTNTNTDEMPPAQPTRMAKFLRVVEALGNALPHPVTLFALFSIAIVLLSGLLGWLDVSVPDPRPVGAKGRADNGLIEDNYVIFNESFSQANPESGGGIFIGGQPGLVAGAPSPGAGNVIVDSNLIRGNLAGAGDGARLADRRHRRSG